MQPDNNWICFFQSLLDCWGEYVQSLVQNAHSVQKEEDRMKESRPPNQSKTSAFLPPCLHLIGWLTAEFQGWNFFPQHLGIVGKHQYQCTGQILEEKYEEQWQAFSQCISISAYYCLSFWRVRIMDGHLKLAPCRLGTSSCFINWQLQGKPPLELDHKGNMLQQYGGSHTMRSKTWKGGMEKETMHISKWKDILIPWIQNRKGNIPHHCFPYIPLSLSHPSLLLWASALEPQLPDKKEV